MSEPVIVTDWDECRVSEGSELQLQGRGFSPYPATPRPRPWPGETEEDQ